MASPTSTWTTYRSARRTRMFPPMAVWYRDLWNHPVASNSAAMVSWLQSQHSNRPVQFFGYGTLAYQNDLNTNFANRQPPTFLNSIDHPTTATWNTATSGGYDYPTSRTTFTGTPSDGGAASAARFPGDTTPGTVRIGSSWKQSLATRYENAAGKPVGLVRPFRGPGNVTSSTLVSDVTTALSNRRLPHISYKPVVTDVISGSQDATWRSLLTNLNNVATTYDGAIWLSVWHEPEDEIKNGQFTIAQWKAVQARIRSLITQVSADRIAFGPIFMGYTFTVTGTSPPERNEENYWEPAADWDFIGVDYYIDTPGEAGSILAPGYPPILQRVRTYARNHNVPAVVMPEFANRQYDAAGAQENADLYTYMVNSWNDGNGPPVIGLNYWDAVDSNTGYDATFPDPSAALTGYRQLIGRSTSLNADEHPTASTPTVSDFKIGGGHQLNDWEPNPATGNSCIVSMNKRKAVEFRYPRVTKGSNTPYAESVAEWDLDSYSFPVGSSGPAGMLPGKVPFAALVVSPDEIKRGWIGHMLAVRVRNCGDGTARWPARATSGNVAQTTSIPRMGHVLRLKRNVNISALPSQHQIVCRALKRYGAIICDTHGSSSRPVELLTAPDPTWDDLRSTQFDLGEFLTLDKFEILDIDGLKVSAGSMQSIPT